MKLSLNKSKYKSKFTHFIFNKLAISIVELFKRFSIVK